MSIRRIADERNTLTGQRAVRSAQTQALVGAALDMVLPSAEGDGNAVLTLGNALKMEYIKGTDVANAADPAATFIAMNVVRATEIKALLTQCAEATLNEPAALPKLRNELSAKLSGFACDLWNHKSALDHINELNQQDGGARAISCPILDEHQFGQAQQMKCAADEVLELMATAKKHAVGSFAARMEGDPRSRVPLR